MTCSKVENNPPCDWMSCARDGDRAGGSRGKWGNWVGGFLYHGLSLHRLLSFSEEMLGGESPAYVSRSVVVVIYREVPQFTVVLCICIALYQVLFYDCGNPLIKAVCSKNALMFYFT